jgi:hypothetical protein
MTMSAVSGRYRRAAAILGAAGLLAACTPGPGAIPAQINNGQAGTAGKTLFAIYMIGSDLEDDMNPRNKVADELEKGGISKVGAGSDDLREIIEGYRSLSEAQKAQVDIVVAFGGARKQGWKGIKYADIRTILEDAGDDYFGNLPQYLHNDPNANMGDPTVFADFVRRVKERAAANGAGRTVVDLWNHGTAYLGMGPDKNPNGGMLRLPAITEGFRSNAFKADIIGFDACLMANLEVAGAVRSAASLMVASEELEPGHGWDYTPIVRAMGAATAATTELAKGIVDSFLDSPRHRSTNGRTLSVIDLGKVDAVLQAVDALSDVMAGNLSSAYAPVLQALGSSQVYGKGSKTGVEYSVDLRHFGQQVAKRQSALGAQAGQVAQAVSQAVLYAREDGTKPNSSGLSIYSLNNVGMVENKRYVADVAATPAWFQFVTAFFGRGTADTVAPTVSGEAPGTQAGADGYNVVVVDNVGVDKVERITAVQNAYPAEFPNAGNRFMVVGQEQLDAGPDGKTYFSPKWDGRTITLTAGGRTMAVPVEFAGTTMNGHKLYSAVAVANEQDVMVFVEWDAQAQKATDYWVVPFSVGEDGSLLLDKDQYEFEAGDTVSFAYLFVDPDSDESHWEQGPVFNLGGAPQFSWARVPGAAFSFDLISDLKGNVSASDVHTIP